MSTNPLPVFYGIKNVLGGKKVVCYVYPANVRDPLDVRSFWPDGGYYFGNLPEEMNGIIAAGAHEIYSHESVLVGVSELLPAGSKLFRWGLNGHSSVGTRREDLGGYHAPPAIHAG